MILQNKIYTCFIFVNCLTNFKTVQIKILLLKICIASWLSMSKQKSLK